MSDNIKVKLQQILTQIIAESYPDQDGIPAIELSVPADKVHGDFACNIAMKSAKIFHKAPIAIAEEMAIILTAGLKASELGDKVDKVEVKHPGFINFFFKSDVLYATLAEILNKKEEFGKSDFGQNEKIMIEFVSANPTGPLSIAHARQAAVGDALTNILKFIGFDAHKEYYVNDGGNQIRMLGKSFRLRMLELLGEKIEYPEECYQGEYIKDMSLVMLNEQREKKELASLIMDDLKALSPDEKEFNLKWLNEWDDKTFENFSASYILDIIEKELLDFNVKFDCWSYESKISTKAEILKMFDLLASKGLTYEQDGALWFKTTDLGDDKDRVLRKSDGSFTYLAPDIVYHKNKFDRGFNRVFDILGPDHHGYIPRLKAAAQALGKKADDVEVLIVQLATIYRNGEVISMSTRTGQYVSLREVMEEIGVDAARFFFLMRHIRQHLDFDLELAKKQSSDNPVYYIQYAYARVNSINTKAQAAAIEMKVDGFAFLTEEEELDLIKKMASFKEALVYCYNQRDPYPLVNYLQELATCFHRFYDRHRVVDEDKNLSSERLALANAAQIVLANGLRLLGVSAPEKM